MARTLRQRQADWRGRRDLKSAHFDILNAARIQKLKTQITHGNKPEEIAVAEFFLAYPRCFDWLASLHMRDGAWRVIASSPIEAAAALVALSEVTSLPAHNVGAPLDVADIELVRGEVAELRRLNLWGTP